MDNKSAILIVEDSKINRIILVKMFSEKYNVLQAENGEEALNIIHNNKDISCILLDLIMPVMDGFEVLSNIKNDFAYSNIPVIVITTDNDSESEIKVLDYGADDFCLKPFKAEIVSLKVKNLVDKFELEKKYASRFDSLTGLFNADSFYAATEKLLNDNPSVNYTIIMTNIEKFKLVNELFDTATGDAILIKIANIIKNKVSKVGTYARLESDHFAMCIPTSNLDIDVIQKQAGFLTSEMDINYAIQLSYGIFIIDNKNLSITQMCDRAKMALNAAKGNYVTSYAFYDDEVRKNLLVEQELNQYMNQAIEEDQFEIYFQPVYSLSKGKMISAEALVRWNHPTKGFISPGLFIPLFERNGFITKLDFYVWDKVCRQIKEWESRFEYNVPISINISRIDMYNPGMVNYIVSLIDKYDIEPRFLKLEVTESAYTENPEKLIEIIKYLQNEGFIVLMDDFGSGYSSLNMLKDLPVDVLKIDLKFLFDLSNNNRAANILTSIVRMAKWLKMAVIVEGVEFENQLEFLRSIGCDEIQGYYFDRPLSKNIFESRLLDPYAKYSTDKRELHDDLEFEDFLQDKEMFLRLINNNVGGFGIFEYNPQNKHLKVVKVNDKYYSIFDVDPYTMFETNSNTLNLFSKRDRNSIIECCERTIKTHNREMVIAFIEKENGEKIYSSISVQYVYATYNNYIISVTINDISNVRNHDADFDEDCDLFKTLFFSKCIVAFDLDVLNDVLKLFIRDAEMNYSKITIDTSESEEIGNSIIDSKNYEIIKKIIDCIIEENSSDIVTKEINISYNNRECVPTKCSLFPLKNDEGFVYKVYGAIDDI